MMFMIYDTEFSPNPYFSLYVYIFFCLLSQFLRRYLKEGAQCYIIHAIIVSRAHISTQENISLNGLSYAHVDALSQRQFLRAQDVNLANQ